MEISVWALSLLAAFVAWDVVLIFLTYRYGLPWKGGSLAKFYSEVYGDEAVQEQGWLRGMWDRVDRAGLSLQNLLVISVVLWVVFFAMLFVIMRDPVVAAVVASIVLYYPKYYLDQAIRRRRELLGDQTADALQCLVGSMRSGLSLEVALERCPSELRRLLSGQANKPMLYEMEQVAYDLKRGISVDDALRRLSERVSLEDIDDFVLAASAVRQKGGNLVDVMERVSAAIRDRREIRQQVQVLTASKRIEVTTLTLSPVAMIFLISLLSPGYLEPMYQHPIGKVAVIAAFGMLAVAFFWARRLAEIEL